MPVSKETKALRMREYRKNNLEKDREYQRNYFLKNKQRIYEINKVTKIKPKTRYTKCVNYSKSRQIEFNLTLEEYSALCNLPCYYCSDVKYNSGYGLDRIDNNKGYTIENVIPCCGDCNVTRSDIYTVEETKVMIEALLEYRKKKCQM